MPLSLVTCLMFHVLCACVCVTCQFKQAQREKRMSERQQSRMTKASLSDDDDDNDNVDKDKDKDDKDNNDNDDKVMARSPASQSRTQTQTQTQSQTQTQTQPQPHDALGGSDSDLSIQELTALEKQAVEREVNQMGVDEVGKLMKLETGDLGKAKKFFGEDMDDKRFKRMTEGQEGFAVRQQELKRDIDQTRRDCDEIRGKISTYQSYLKQVKNERDGQLRELESTLRDVMVENDRLQGRLRQMIRDRDELLQTQLDLKSKRRDLINSSNVDFMDMDTKEEQLNAEISKLKAEFETENTKKVALFQEVARLEAERAEAEAKLKRVRDKVEGYRQMLADVVN